MKILITGATGLVGKRLGIELVKAGHKIVVLSRSATKAQEVLPFPCEVIEGNLVVAPLNNLPADIEGVVHLAGEGVAEKRWTKDQKEKLQSSRVEATANLIKSFTNPPKVFLSASAIGFYGDRGDEELSEASDAGKGFLPELCQRWEDSTNQLSQQTRIAIFRIGIVLARDGGALAKMLPAFQMGVGGTLGSGNQWMSWIHVEDLVKMLCWALENESAKGVFNAVAPRPVQQKIFAKELAQVLNKWMGPPVPGFVLKTLFGELATVLLSSQKVNTRVGNFGFSFQYAELSDALKNILSVEAQGEELLERVQFCKSSIEKVFAYYADAKNLEDITPPFLNFKIVNMNTANIEKGTLLDYKLKLHGIPVSWQTEILEFERPTHFVDNQNKGPYSLWHHTHTFESLGDGTLVRDLVRYKLPMGVLGKISGLALVKKDLKEIFDYRAKRMREIFG